MEQYIPGRRIKPVREGSSRLVLNKPNVPPPEIRSIQELRITLISHKPIDCNGYQHKPATVEDESGLVKAVELTPKNFASSRRKVSLFWWRKNYWRRNEPRSYQNRQKTSKEKPASKLTQANKPLYNHPKAIFIVSSLKFIVYS